MRAIGKGSLSTVLAGGLHVVRVVLLVVLALICLALLIMPFADSIAVIAKRSEHIIIDGGITLETYLHVAYGLLAVTVMLYVINRLLEILQTLRLGSPFVRENADRFRKIGFALIIGEGGGLAIALIASIFRVDIKFDIEVIAWIAILTVFVLSEVFLEGARMKEEQDLTV